MTWELLHSAIGVSIGIVVAILIITQLFENTFSDFKIVLVHPEETDIGEDA